MKRTSTVRRVALATLISALVGGTSILLAGLLLTLDVGKRQLPQNQPRPGGPEHRFCLSDPEGFHFTHGFFETYAYDAKTLVSPTRGAPALERAYPLPDVGQMVPVQRNLAYAELAVRLASAGPCSLMVMRWHPSGQRLPHAAGVIAFGLGAVACMSLMFALWVSRPFLRQIQRLTTAAASVGSQDYVTAQGGQTHDLETIARALDTAHRELMNARKQLEARHAALEHHLNAVAHDVRTPLASLSMTLESLDEDLPPAQWREAVRQALDDVVFLTGLAENLALEARFREQEAPVRVDTDLADLVRRVTARFSALVRRSDARVEASVTDVPTVPCDPVMMEQALVNLVANGLAHGGPQVTVIVVLDEDDAGFMLRVVDDGPGISSEVLRRFEAREAYLPSAQSTGRGLIIARRALELQGFRLTLSASSEGTEALICPVRSDLPGPV